MAWTQSDVDKIKAMMVSGVRSATFADGRQVQYRDMDELAMALQLAQAEVTPTGSNSTSYASFGKD